MSTPFRVLVFSKTAGYRHKCIPDGIAMFRRLAATSQEADEAEVGASFQVDASEDAEIFTEASLARYRVVVLFQTSGDFLDAAQLAALRAYVEGGRGGILGIHAAATGRLSCCPDGWYGRLLGAVFQDHPEPQLGRVVLHDRSHPTVAALLPQLSATEASAVEPSFSVFDEWYNFTADSRALSAMRESDPGPSPSPKPKESTKSKADVHVLLSVDETTYKGGQHGKAHPVAWWQDFEGTGTRVFYTALGHFGDVYEDVVFERHLRDALLWTARI